MTAYYNELDPYAAQWLRNLIDAGEIAPGVVDERSIVDVAPSDLAGFTQCHFFAGIGVWSYALRRAGWHDDRPVWTGSCPCQPFSAAGRHGGFGDERHLWPVWRRLIGECRPPAIFGEQVASRDADSWIDLVAHDLEGMGFAFGAVAFPAAGIGAPHMRDRTWFVGYAGDAETLADADRQQFAGGNDVRRQQPEIDRRGVAGDRGPVGGQWADADWLACRDGHWRAVEPGTFPLAHGVAARMGRLRAYGNAINAEAAATFIRAVA